jgi:glycosyltransferase involved in cell wall biosynthesis
LAAVHGWPWDAVAFNLPPVPDELAWPRISIVTPSYNQAAYMEETIRSVLLQGYPDLEYWIMDGGSTDGSVEIIRRYESWISGWVSEPDEGQSHAINKGLSRASGDLVAYINSDDLYLPGALHAVAAYHLQNPSIGLIYGQCQVIDPGGRVLGMLPAHHTSARRMIQRGDYCPQPATFWSRQAMEAVGHFDTSLHFAMDYEYFIRIARTFPLAYLPVPLAAFRRHRVSKTVSQEERHWREALSVSERHGLSPRAPWYWIRRVRHRGLRLLPAPLQRRVHRVLGRVIDV